MSHDDFTGHLERYLEEYPGSTPLPEHVRDAVRARLPSTRQQRFVVSNQAVGMALATAAVVAALVLGITFTRGDGVGDPAPTTPLATAAPTSSRPPMSVVAGSLDPGTYTAGDPFTLDVTFTVPDGWQGRIAGPYLVELRPVDYLGGISFSMFDLVAADPCHLLDEGYVDPTPGPAVDDLETALTNMRGIEVTDRADVTVDGYSGAGLTISAPDSFAGCNLPADGYVLWRLPLDFTHTVQPGERNRVSILDVDGQRLVIAIREPVGTTDEQRAEAQAIFDSIQIEGP
jgi:hypothetical protein